MSVARVVGAAPKVVAIAGGSGAGKSTAVAKLASVLRGDLVVLEQDHYYVDQSARSADERRRLNFDHPDAIEFARLAADLSALASGRTVEAPRYDFATHTRCARTASVEPRPVVVVEGTLVLHDAEIRNVVDVRVFVEAAEETRFARRLARDVRERGRSADDVRAQYLATVRPMHDRFVEPQRARAHLVIDGSVDAMMEEGSRRSSP